jgi:ferritin
MKQTAQFFYNQADEEHQHAMKFLKYVVDTGGQVVIPAISAPKATFSSAEEAVQLSLTWEQEVTRQINNLMDIAVSEKDYAAQQFLNWFTNEQIEEVSTMETLLKIVRQIQDKNLFMFENIIANMGTPAEGEA